MPGNEDDAQKIAESISISFDDLFPQLKEVFGDIQGISGEQLLITLGFRAGDDIFAQVADSTLEEAAARAADLIGKRVLDDGSIIDNPNPEFAITDSTRDMLFDDINAALEEGLSAGAIRDSIVESYGFSPQRALNIARTERSFAQNRGALVAAKASGVVKTKAWVRGGEQDCDICEANADQGPIPINEEFDSSDDAPPGHPSCFPAGTEVLGLGSIRAGSKRWYQGEMVRIVTDSGEQLTATPNHPILTDRGAVPIRDLKQGDNLFLCRKPRIVEASVDPNHQDMPAAIEDIASALLMGGGMLAAGMPVAAEDFHGDGILDSKVDIVWAAGFLAHKRQVKERSELHFIRRAMRLARFAFHGIDALLFERNRPRLFGSAHALTLNVPGATIPIGDSGLSHGANKASVSLKSIAKRMAVATTQSRKRSQRCSRSIQFDQMFDLVLGLPSGPRGLTTHDAGGLDRQSTFTKQLRNNVGAAASHLRRSMDRTSPTIDAIDNRDIQVANPNKSMFGAAIFGPTLLRENQTYPSTGTAYEPTDLLERMTGFVEFAKVRQVERQPSFVGHVYNLTTESGWYVANGIIVQNCVCTIEFSTDDAPDEEDDDGE